MFTNNNLYTYGQCSYESPKWEEVWAQEAYNLLPLAEERTIDVLNIAGEIVEKFRLAGPTVYSENPRMFLFTGDAPLSFQNAEAMMLKQLEIVGVSRMFPAHPNWIEVTDDVATFRVLTADNAYTLDVENANFSRGQLYYHLKPGKSRYFGRFVCRIVEGGILADHDGFSYARKSSFPMVPGTLWKAIGYKNLKGFISNQELVAKGVVKLLSDAEFEWLRREYDVADDVDIIIPKITCKFHKQESRVVMDFYSLFRGEDRLIAKYSLKMFKTLPLTRKGLELAYCVFSEEIDKMFNSLSTKNRGALISLMGKVYREFVESSESEDDSEFRMDLAEMTSTMNSLLYLPMGDEEVIGKVLHLLLKNMRKVKAPGMTGVACPGLDLKWFEIRVPKSFLRRYGKKVGDKVTLYRAPFTGIEAATVTIVGTTDEGIEIDPIFWAERFSGDFDGDLAGILTEADLIDESRIGDAASSKKKGKKAYTVTMATAKAWFSKLSISKMDMVITACLELGIDPTPARELMQAIIDMVKHEVELPEDMDEFIINLLGGELSLPAIHSLFNLYRSPERRRQSVYNVKVDIMHKEGSNIELLDMLIPHFKHVLCKSKYIAPDDNGYLDKIHKQYSAICRKLGYADYATPKDFNAPAFDKNVVTRNTPAAAIAVKKLAAKPKVAMVATDIRRQYGRMQAMFGKGRITEGYAIMKHLYARFAVSDPELIGDAIKYLFMCIVHKGNNLPKSADFGWYLKVVAYMPLEIGSWSLKRASKFYGGTPAMDIAVVSTKK